MSTLSTSCWQPADIAYCSNVHPGENIAEIKQNLSTFIEPVRQQRGLDSMATGLWISAAAAMQLQDSKELADFRQAMDSAKLKLTSLNGFVYGGFHQTKVKSKVYLPDWSEFPRLNYTKQLAEILAACLPDDCHSGAISTVPLGYKRDWNDAKLNRALTHFTALTDHLDDIAQRTGKQIQVCLEMEPDCLLETSDELIRFFEQYVRPIIPHSNYLAVCFDVCHQAVMHEDIWDSLNRITEAGITIGKIQLSSALRADFSLSKDDNKQLLELLAQFAEPKYLHQVKILNDKGQLTSSADLSSALQAVTNQALPLNSKQQWRIHFHVPVNHHHLLCPKLQTTHSDLYRVFDFLCAHSTIRPLLEVETYSWQVLPELLRPQNDADLITGIVGELCWIQNQLTARKLLVR